MARDHRHFIPAMKTQRDRRKRKDLRDLARGRLNSHKEDDNDFFYF